MVQATNGITAVVRPQSLEEMVGLDHVKNTLKYAVRGAQRMGEPVPSFLVDGAAGCGKSTIGGAIANMTNGGLYKHIGTELKKADDIYNMIVPNVKDGDVVFIEEAHTLGKDAQTILLEWIENFKLLGGGFTTDDAPKVCFVLATTNPGKIKKPLRERCIRLQVGYYKIDALKQILVNAASKFELDLAVDDKALTLLAQSSRGVPRTAVHHRLNMLRRVMAVDELPYCLDTVHATLTNNGINEWGLEANDISYANILADKIEEGYGRPVSQKTMSHSTGFDTDLCDLIESYLLQISALRIDSRGRSLTDFGYELIGREAMEYTYPPNKEPILNRKVEIDMDKLRELLTDENLKKKGMKGIMPMLGLTYIRDNPAMRKALLDLGYTVRKKAGIVSLE